MNVESNEGRRGGTQETDLHQCSTLHSDINANTNWLPHEISPFLQLWGK